MTEYNMVSDIENAIVKGLETMFENLDTVAGIWQADSHQMLEQLMLSISDLDIAYEYSNWITDSWDNE